MDWCNTYRQLCYRFLKELFVLYNGSCLGMILMFHRVVENQCEYGHPWIKQLHVTSSYLENLLVNLRSQGYEIISLDDLYSRLKNGREKSRFAVFTFDDGFRDTYELAYPIFSKHNAPFTVYVTTAVPDNDFIWWHYMLDDLVYRNDLLDITLLGERRLFESKTAKQKFHAYKAIDGLVNSIEPDHRREALETIFTSYGLNSAVYAQKLSMTWDQIRELSRSRLATIGSHTVNHPNLALMSPQAAVDEMERGRMRIRDKLGIPVDHFCYPYGGKSAARCREFDLVKSLCFKTATTTRYGYITYRHHTAMERLPRIMVDMSTTIQGILP